MKEPGTIAPNLMRRLLVENRLEAAERFRLERARLDLTPTMRAILEDALIRAMPVTEMERKYRWPARSAKAIVGVLLDILGESATPEVGLQGTRAPAQQMLEHITAMGFDRALAGHMARWGLNLGEARVLEIMRRAPDMTMTREALIARLCPHDDDPPDGKIVDVRISRLRKKITGSGVAIQTLWGIGWKLTWPPDLSSAPPTPSPAPAPAQRHESGGDARAQAVSDEELLDYVALAPADKHVATLMARFGLSHKQACVLEALLSARGRHLGRATLHRMLYDDDAGEADPKIIDVMLTHIRRKIAPQDWRIENEHGRGWRLVAPKPDDPPPEQAAGG